MNRWHTARFFAKHGSEYLSPSEVVSRLRGEFRYVEVDLQQGDEHVKSMVEQLTRMQDLEPPPASSEEIERLKAARGQALFVCIFDEPQSEDAVLTTEVDPIVWTERCHSLATLSPVVPTGGPG